MRQDLKTYLLEHINIREFYTDIFEDYKPGINVNCPFHADDVPSMSIRERDGAIFCHACGAKASSVIGFYEAYKKISFKESMRRLWSKTIGPTVPSRRISTWAKRLQSNKKMLAWLAERRGINAGTCKLLRLGWDGDRITIPVFNDYSVPVNVRRYHSKRKPKVLSYGKGFGGAALYPIDKYRDDDAEVYLFEGELDTILAWQYGYNALTSTAGANSWTESFSKTIAGKDVVICYDTDKAGRQGASKVAEHLRTFARSIRVVHLPLTKPLKDFTDYIVQEGATTASFDRLVRRAENLHVTSDTKKVETLKDDAPIQVRLHEASKGDLFYRPISTEAHVTGKRLTPYLPPRRVSIQCRMDRGKLCTTCHMLPADGKKTFKFKNTDRRILGLIGVKDATARTSVRDIAKIPAQCSVKIETLSTFNIEEITVTPPIDDASGSYTSRLAYSIGHGLESNRSYAFEGYTVPHPSDQSATHIFTAARPLQTHLDTYATTRTILKRLERFRARPGQIGKRIKSIARFLANRVSKIVHRPLMHVGIDLAFHSPLQFYFNNEKVKKGYLEIAVIGDTRCGKGYVSTELSRYYGVGEIATAENCSFAGLIGGITKHQNTYSISWGLIPRNNGRLVIIDETSGLDTRDIGKMTRVRSEGIAEIFKIQSESTNARTRIIWLSNTRTGRPVNTYAYGVETAPELFGKSEDVSKLDYVVIVQSGDVDPEHINRLRGIDDGEDRYHQADFRDLIMWIWTRKPSQVIFTDDATHYILAESLLFGRTYHPSIPLVQVEDIRIKLARVAAAVAGRVFSTDSTRKNLLVTKECAEVGVRFIRRLYDNPPASYLSYSEAQYSATKIPEVDKVQLLFDELGEYRGSFITGMLDTKQVGVTDVADFLNCDRYTAKEVVGKLVRAKCLIKNYTWYEKKPAFIELLRRMR